MEIMQSGYAQTPLAKKLGMKSGFSVLVINRPEHYYKLFSDLPSDFESWWRDIQETIWSTRTELPKILCLSSGSTKVPIPDDKRFLFHIALMRSDAPPEVVEVLLKQDANTAALPLPRTSSRGT